MDLDDSKPSLALTVAFNELFYLTTEREPEDLLY